MMQVKPYKDELLSSWLFRLSRANYTNIITIYNSLFHIKNLHKKDIDYYRFTDKSLKVFSIPIKKYQLLRLEGYLEEEFNTDGRHRWITPCQKTYHSKSFPGTRFCPECLKEKAYIRQYWRLLFVNICERHNCYLFNTCPNCNKPLRYINIEYNQRIYECFNCKFDFRLIEPVYINKRSKELKYQKLLLNIMNCGYYKLNNRYYYSIGLFYLLRILIKNIMKTKKVSRTYIEELSPQELSYFITYSLILLKKFPNRLSRFYKKHKFTNTNRIFDKYRYKTKNIPNWYLSGIHFNTVNTRWYF